MIHSRRSIAARVGLVVALGLLAVGVYFVCFGVSWNHKFEVWVTEEPVRIRMDLAKSGSFEAPFNQTCDIAHAQSVELRPVAAADLSRVREMAEQVSVRIHVVKPGDGREYAHPDEGAFSPPPAESVRVQRWVPAPNGSYTFQAEVTGVPELGSLPADLIVRNELCGLERMPGQLGFMSGGALGFLGLIVGFVSLVFLTQPRTGKV